jgi:hypothetical protein
MLVDPCRCRVKHIFLINEAITESIWSIVVELLFFLYEAVLGVTWFGCNWSLGKVLTLGRIGVVVDGTECITGVWCTRKLKL